MQKPRVVALLTQELYDELMPPARAAAEGLDVVHVPVPADDAGVREALMDADACMTSWKSPCITGAHLTEASRLKVIGHAAGSVKGIVAPEVFDRGITVLSSAHVIGRFVAEMALLFTLALMRNLTQNDRAMKDGVLWKPNEWTHTDTLLEKRVGLVGFGQVAREFARLLAPFNVELFVHDPYVSPDVLAQFGAEPAELDEIVAGCSILSLHAPDIPATRHMIDARRLAMMRDGSVIVNTARGALIDEVALTRELESGRLSAALDSFEKQPLPLDSPLRRLPNVILTPKLGGPVLTRRYEMAEYVLRTIKAYLVDGALPADGVVAKEALEVIA